MIEARKHTHPYITSIFLRNCYARELKEARRSIRKSGDKHMILFGMESGVWAIQKGLLRLSPIWQLKRILREHKKRAVVQWLLKLPYLR